MIRPVQVTAQQCQCDVCGYQWLSFAATTPQFCPNRQCRSREWNRKRRTSKAQEIKFPAPRKPGRPRTVAFLGDEP